MREITEQEMQSEVFNGTGFTHFMGGGSSHNGKVIVNLGDKFLLFSKEEMEVITAYNASIFELEKQAKEYLESLKLSKDGCTTCDNYAYFCDCPTF